MGFKCHTAQKSPYMSPKPFIYLRDKLSNAGELEVRQRVLNDPAERIHLNIFARSIEDLCSVENKYGNGILNVVRTIQQRRTTWARWYAYICLSILRENLTYYTWPKFRGTDCKS